MRSSLALALLLWSALASAGKPGRPTPAGLFKPIYSTNADSLRAMVVNDTFPAGNLSALGARWLPPDHEFAVQMTARRGLYKQYKRDVFGVAPGYGHRVRVASQELLDELVVKLTTDHPDHYTLAGRTLVDQKTGYRLNLDDKKLHPLVKAGLITQDDLTINMRGADGKIRMVGAFVATPTNWGTHDFLGMTLDEIHANVGGYEGKLKTMINGMAEKLQPGRDRLRNNWFIGTDHGFSRPTWQPPGTSTNPRVPGRWTKNNVGQGLVLRSEIETLVRLQNSQALVFTIRPRTWSMDFVRAEAPEIALDVAAGVKAAGSGYETAPWANVLTRYLSEVPAGTVRASQKPRERHAAE